ncbi:MAG TPA: diphthine--ammonia ligase [Candidatus Acidoferrum sp.]|nr:diphthine--ammonia ligase [Candidatus Acidoferrum sp.]
MGEQVIVGWSGGKDSAFALHEILRDDRYQVAGLLTTVTSGYDRISMHGVRRSLLRRQAEALGLQLWEAVIPIQASNQEYEAQMGTTLAEVRSQFPAVSSCVFGDLFLEEIRAYRERMLGQIGMRGVFPLWRRDTAVLAREFVRLGYKAVVVCVDTAALPQRFAGMEFDEDLLRSLPAGIDPCGENGEMHTFVYDGPIFATPIAHRKGEVVLRESRFAYCDLLEDQVAGASS